MHVICQHFQKVTACVAIKPEILTTVLECFSQRSPNPRPSITGGPPEPSQSDPVTVVKERGR